MNPDLKSQISLSHSQESWSVEIQKSISDDLSISNDLIGIVEPVRAITVHVDEGLVF